MGKLVKSISTITLAFVLIAFCVSAVYSQESSEKAKEILGLKRSRGYIEKRGECEVWTGPRTPPRYWPKQPFVHQGRNGYRVRRVTTTCRWLT